MYRSILQLLQPKPIKFLVPNPLHLWLCKITQLIIPPMMSGRPSAAFIPNFPSSDAKALSLALIHSFRPASSLGGDSPPPDATAPHLHQEAMLVIWFFSLLFRRLILSCLVVSSSFRALIRLVMSSLIASS